VKKSLTLIFLLCSIVSFAQNSTTRLLNDLTITDEIKGIYQKTQRMAKNPSEVVDETLLEAYLTQMVKFKNSPEFKNLSSDVQAVINRTYDELIDIEVKAEKERIAFEATIEPGRYDDDVLADLEANLADDFEIAVIGSQTWMAENLNVNVFRNGDTIPEAKTNEEWIKAGEEGKPAWCYYNNDTANGRIYGKLYNWYAVDDKRGLAPKGWHIPSNTDWDSLIDLLGGEDIVGPKIKSIELWENEINLNETGFSAKPSMSRWGNGDFDDYVLGFHAYFWSTTETNDDFTNYYTLMDSSDGFFKLEDSKSHGFSIRCIKD
jgi:uncharacterized protein (TIGR02145 family)